MNEESDHKAIVFMDPKHFALEAELYDSKWWDYRLMHPTDATMCFAKAYVDAVKGYLKKQIDLYVGTNARVLKADDFFLESKTTITGMWKARQAADKHGVPYDFWCNRAMDYADSCCWPYYPKPSYLYSDKAKETLGDLEGISMTEYILARWAEWSQVNTLVATDAFYHPSQNTDHPYHIEHQASLVRQIQRRSSPEFALAHYIYDNHILSETYAKKHFSEKVLFRAKSLSE